ncbi:MAG: transglycosylase SLT domain-containing protein [Candidatus Magasanikiibacteriota bacterium]
MGERRGIPPDVARRYPSARERQKSHIDEGKRGLLKTIAGLTAVGVSGALLANNPEARGFLRTMAENDKLAGGLDLTLADKYADARDIYERESQEIKKQPKSVDQEREEGESSQYDNALQNEFDYFTQREKDRGGKFDYKNETTHALMSEKYHLWDARIKSPLKSEMKSHRAYYAELLNKNKQERENFLQMVTKVCEVFEVPVSIALGVMMTETKANHDDNVVKGGWKNLRKGPQGIMQIDSDAETLVKKVFKDKIAQAKNSVIKNGGEDSDSEVRRHTLEGNIILGVAYLKLMHTFYDGQWGMACAAYSGGMGTVDNRIMAQMSGEFHDELEDRKENSEKYKGSTAWGFQRKKINEFLRRDNANIVKAYTSQDEGGWGWDDDKKHSSQYPFFVFHSGKTAFNILSSRDENPQIGSFFKDEEEKRRCEKLRKGKSQEVAKL